MSTQKEKIEAVKASVETAKANVKKIRRLYSRGPMPSMEEMQVSMYEDLIKKGEKLLADLGATK